MAASGHEVIFAVVDLSSIRHRRKWGKHYYVRDGIEVYSIDIPCGRIPKNIYYKIGIIALKYIYKTIEKSHGKPGITHAHFAEIGYITTKVSDFIGSPLVITEHSSAVNKRDISPSLHKVVAYAYKKADSLIAVSKSLADNIRNNFGIEAKIVPNIVDLSIFTYNNEITSSIYNIVSTGNLIYGKRMDLLIKAFNVFQQSRKRVSLTIFGEGPERPKLEELISKLDLSQKVILRGLCERGEIANKLHESNLFVLASQSETFGVSYVEALATGVPVIATRCGGPESFVDDTNGILIPVDNLEALVEAMKSLYKNIKKYDRKKISDMAKEKFSPQMVTNKLIEIYEDVINDK